MAETIQPAIQEVAGEHPRRGTAAPFYRVRRPPTGSALARPALAAHQFPNTRIEETRRVRRQPVIRARRGSWLAGVPPPPRIDRLLYQQELVPQPL
jgi:hypothetical protein